MTLKTTALHAEHIRLGGKMVDFGGWHLPVQYSGLADEHKACREAVGLFDVSHMGEVSVRGPGATDFLNSIITNNLERIKPGQAQYTVMCNESGGCVDDLIIHQEAPDDYFICVNASNTDKDFEWIRDRAPSGVSVINESPNWSQIAIQGRYSLELLQKLVDYKLDQIKYYNFIKTSLMGKTAYVARTGYTGEDGFEVYVPWMHATNVWGALLEVGQSKGIKPCGLGARDTLRTEMKFPLYGHEIDDKLNPLEAGLSWVVKLEKNGFVGQSSLNSIKQSGLKQSLVGLKSLGRGIPRQGYLVAAEDTICGIVTSGTMSPSLGYGIAIAYVPKEFAAVGQKLNVIIRGVPAPHEVVATPFYKRDY